MNNWGLFFYTDDLTRFAAAKAMPTAEATEIVKFIVEEILLKYAGSKEMISDCELNFLSNAVKDINYARLLIF